MGKKKTGTTMGTLYRFTPTSEAVLRSAGWSSDRRVDTEEYEALYRREGFPIHPFVIEFLSFFGGIAVYPPQSPIWPAFEFDPFEAVANTDRERLNHWEEDQLVPIGLSGLLTMFVAVDGTVLGDDDGPPGMVLLGNSLVEAIEYLCQMYLLGLRSPS